MSGPDQMVLARRYAQAYLSLPGTHLIDANVIYRASHWFSENPHVLVLLSYLSGTVFEGAVRALIEQWKLPESLTQLLRILRNDRRVPQFKEVLYCIGRMLDAMHNVCRATVFCCPRLDAQQLVRLERYLSEKCNCSVLLDVRHDPGLIAGIRVVSKDWSWERSVAKKVRKLQALCWKHVI